MTNKQFDLEVCRILDLMSTMDPTQNEYSAAAEALRVVCDARAKKPAFPVSPDVLVQVVGSLLGIAAIIGHERLHVITTRAIGFVKK